MRLLIHIVLYSFVLTALAGCLREREGNPPRLESTSPKNGEERVGVTDYVTFTFSKGLNPSTVNADTVVAETTTRQVPVRLALSVNGNEITIIPALGYWGVARTYEVRLSGITDLRGKSIADTELVFHTIRNPSIVRTSYDLQGEPTGYTLYEEYDEYGNPQLRDYVNDPGVDGEWFTPDDVVADSTADLYESEDRWFQTGMIVYDPGLDGVFHTADDDIASYSVNEADKNFNRARYIHFVGPGTDGLWQTADDEIGDYRVNDWDDVGRYLGAVTFNGAGADGQWLTADDDISSYATATYTPEGFVETQANFTGPGADGVFMTDDDVGSYWAYVVDAGGRTIEQSRYTDNGTDGVWFTADDVLNQKQIHEWEGEDLKRIVYYDPADTVIRIYAWLERNEHLQQTRTANFAAPGPDGEWGTSDDVIDNSDIFAYESNGGSTLWRDFNGPGGDGVWLTDDDTFGVEATYDPTL